MTEFAAAAGVRRHPKKTGASQSDSASAHPNLGRVLDGAQDLERQAAAATNTLDAQTILAGLLAGIRQAQQIPPERALWDKEDIAIYFKVSLSQVYKELVCKPTFPKPVKVGSRERWIAGEIMAWAHRQR